jgi:diguanylate cyclase (GGDEF)-like protein
LVENGGYLVMGEGDSGAATPPTGPPVRSAPRSTSAAAETLAREWADALSLAADPVPGRAALDAHLTLAVDRLASLVSAARPDAVAAEPADPVPGDVGLEPARTIGADLVAAGFDNPESLGATLAVLGLRLPGLADGDTPGGRARTATVISGVIAELAIGFNRAVREQSHDVQAGARRSVKMAHLQAERVLQESEHRLRHAALHDALTGLPNRVLFEDRLSTLFGNARPGDRVGICFVDIDGFKMVNDQFGHQLGDLVLVAVADRLRRLADDTGHLVARFGGDEFAILVPAPNSAGDVIKVADRALSALTAPVKVDGHTVQTQASVGVVERAVTDGDPTDLLRAADMTLHWAKSDPDLSWQLYDGERSAREVARYALLGDLPAALDTHQVVPYYQPLVRLRDRRVVGYEALARWQHPELGTLGPDRFIALAETSGLIVPLGAGLLRDACHAAAGWAATAPAGEAPYISVNVAVRQIRHGTLVETVTGILDETGLAAHLLQLEITESDSVDQDHRSHESLQELAGLGVRLAIDDFGSGYSNLGYLQAMPLHELKIDARFLSGLPADDSGRSLLPTLVDLAHTLDMTALAEGVETPEQADYLTAIGCDLGQGWFFGRPQPASEITRRP